MRPRQLRVANPLPSRQTSPVTALPEHDLSDRQDIVRLVDAFYEKVREDEQLAPIFNLHVKDWAEHMPTLYDFWANMLLRDASYRGNPWSKHQPLDLERAHFRRWLELFLATVDELFCGPRAEQAKGAAQSIAHGFQIRKGIDPFS